MRRSYDVVFYQPWISTIYLPDRNAPSGGAETQIDMLARELAARGWRVAVIANPDPGLPQEVGGVRIIQRPRSPRVPVIGPLLGAVARWRALLGIDTDVIVKRVAGFDTAVVALAAKARRRRFVYSSANVVDFEFSRLEGRLKVALFELGVRLSDRIVVQAHEQEDLCVRRFGRRPVVIKSIAAPALERSEEPRAFLWIGRIVPYKRPLAFVELARALPEAQFEMVAVLSGDHDRALHRELLRGESELENLILVPPGSKRAVSQLIESAVAVVGTAEYEGMPNVFLEAWARGVPALSLMHDPDRVIEVHGLGEFAAGSQERLVELGRGMWQTRHEQTEVARRCREYVASEHAVEAVAERWAEALELPNPGAVRGAASTEVAAVG